MDNQFISPAIEQQAQRILADPKQDSIFKGIFTLAGEHSNKALKSCIGAIIGRKVTEAKVRNVETIDELLRSGSIRLDVHCVLDDDSIVNIEMQSQRQYYPYGDRAYANTARLTSINLPRGKQRWVKIPKVIGISFLDWTFDSASEEAFSTFELRNIVNGTRLTDRLTIHFVELTKLKKYLVMDVSKLDDRTCWALYFKHAGDQNRKRLIEEISRKEDGIMDAVEAQNTFSDSYSKQLHKWAIQMARMDRYSNECALMEMGEKKRQEKIQQKFLSLTQQMKEKGCSSDEILTTLRQQLFQE